MYLFKEGRSYAKKIADPYDWALMQFSDGPYSCSGVSDYAKIVLEH
jgi:hypothetical protein